MKFEIPTPTAQTAEAHSAQEEFTLEGTRRGMRNIEFGQLTSKKRVFGEFRDELRKLCAGHFCLFLAQGRHRQHNLRKRPEIRDYSSMGYWLTHEAH
jgi:hypothetical protein